MVKSTKFQIPTLEYAAKNEILKPITLFYMIRSKYRISIIHNYSPNHVKQLTNLHWKTVDRYVNTLIKHGFAKIEDGDLILLNPYKGTFVELETRPYTSFEGMYRRIISLLLTNNIEQQKYNIAVNYKIGLQNLNSMQSKKASKVFKNRKVELESEIAPTVTCTSVSRLLKVTRLTANKIIHELINKNYITAKNKIIKKCKCDSLGNLQRGRFFIKGGYLFKHCGREINIGSYLENKGLVAQ